MAESVREQTHHGHCEKELGEPYRAKQLDPPSGAGKLRLCFVKGHFLGTLVSISVLLVSDCKSIPRFVRDLYLLRGEYREQKIHGSCGTAISVPKGI